MATVQAAKEQRLVLYGIDWRTYLRMARALSERRCVRLTYDRGLLEIMTISPEHERYKYLLILMIAALSDELGIVIAGFGSMTCKRRPSRGLEPDQCYWIANEPLVHARVRIDLRTDPPPDLMLEIDISSKSTRRMKLYARMRVPEVWRFDGQVMTFLTLSAAKKYVPAATSLSFSGLKADDLARFLNLSHQTDEKDLIAQFRAWVRQNLVGPKP
jgi:Uma2 family endonuclease